MNPGEESHDAPETQQPSGSRSGWWGEWKYGKPAQGPYLILACAKWGRYGAKELVLSGYYLFSCCRLLKSAPATKSLPGCPGADYRPSSSPMGLSGSTLSHTTLAMASSGAPSSRPAKNSSTMNSTAAFTRANPPCSQIQTQARRDKGAQNG